MFEFEGIITWCSINTLSNCTYTHMCCLSNATTMATTHHGSVLVLISPEYMKRCRTGIVRTGRTLVLLVCVRILRCYCLAAWCAMCFEITIAQFKCTTMCFDFDFV